MSKVLMGFVGDVLVNRDNPREAFQEVAEVLKAPAVMFGNLEGAYTDRPSPMPGVYGGVAGPSHNLDVFADVGFNVMSMANNHIFDLGYEAMMENRARLRERGVRTCGVGPNSAEAREPAILEAEGLRIGFLAYASVFPIGFEARPNAPGVASMRAYDFWSGASQFVHMPGVPPRIKTIPDEADLARLTEDIRRLRPRVDLLITSFHWGDQTRAYELTDHETRTARYCIDNGVDLVVGHHHHALRGMEWYKGKPIMYGLGHFVFDFRLPWTPRELEKLRSEVSPGDYWRKVQYNVEPQDGWPYLPMHADTRMTVVAWARADKGGVTEIGFLPCKLAADGVVHPLAPDSPDFDELVKYVEQGIVTQGLNGAIVRDPSATIAGLQTLRVTPKSENPGGTGGDPRT